MKLKDFLEIEKEYLENTYQCFVFTLCHKNMERLQLSSLM